jgi:hypothetical protein
MGHEMKAKHSAVVILSFVVGILMMPEMSFAGWGAIACNQKNANCGVSYGWPNLREAEGYALVECLKANKNCHIYRWEHDTCIRGLYGAYTCN